MNAHESECWNFADYALQDCERRPTPNEILRLAKAIEQTIKDWMEDRDSEAEAARDLAIDRKIDEKRMGDR